MPTSVTSKTATLVDHVLTNSSQKVSQSGVIELDISDHDLVYCTRKTPFLKLNKHNGIFFRSIKNCTHKKKILEQLRKTDFPNCWTFTFLNKAYQDSIFRLREVIDLLCPSKNLKIEG